MKTKPLHIGIPEDMFVFIKITAIEKKMTMGELVMQAIEKTYKRNFERKTKEG